MEAQVAERLLAVALRYPGAHEDHPWGETVVKVDGKIFVFLQLNSASTLRLTVKLPDQAAAVIAEHPSVAQPMGYGLGKSGWVSFSIPAEQPFDEAALLAGVDVAYRAVAKKRRLRELGGL